MPQSTEAAFREAIRLSPDEDLPRLVYADWLEEQGDPLGEFIRVQCELARLPWYDPRCRRLKRRELQLLAEHRREWSRDLHIHGARIGFQRGLPSQISLSVDEFLQHSVKFFEAALIQSARLKMPMNLLLNPEGWKRVADSTHVRKLRSLSMHWSPLLTDRRFSQNLTGLLKLDLSEASGILDDTLSTVLECPDLINLRSLSLPNMLVNSDPLGLLLASSIGRNLKELRLPYLRPTKYAPTSPAITDEIVKSR